MPSPNKTLWRIEFQLDLTRPNAPVVPIGFLLESQWREPKARWLGMIFRRSLTTNELRGANTETWPELLNLEGFLKPLFDRAWSVREGTGGAVLASEYSVHSALRFVHDKSEAQIETMTSKSLPGAFQALYGDLLQLESRLTPVCAAEIIPFSGGAEREAGDYTVLNEAA